MDLAISGNGLLIAVLAIVALVVGIILFFRQRMGSSGPSLSEKYQGGGATSLSGRNKYPDVDIFKMRGPILNFGMLCALGLIVLAFNWTKYDEDVYVPDDALVLDEEIEVEPPRTAEPPPPPPPPPPPVIEEVPEEEIEEEEEVEFEDTSIEEETEVEAPPPPEPVKEAPPPPPPPPPEPEVDEIFKVVEQMPRFPGCENEADEAAKKQCADKKMLQFIYKNIKYPAIARENGVEGQVVISFVVDKKGNITEPKIVRDIGAQCGKEALRVVNMMTSKAGKWTPGKQRGKSVKVQYNLPVRFRLE